MITIDGDWHVVAANAAQTMQVGAALARQLSGGLVVTLSGDLGAGKTTLVRGILRELGWTSSVKSPTYSLVEHYLVSSLYFYHFDLYRLRDPDEWDSAGLSEYFRADAVCVIEWPERMLGVLPAADLAVTIALASSGRAITVTAHGEVGKACLIAAASSPLT